MLENKKQNRANAAGTLLRIARIRQEKGQKEICDGICVVSYLSKIERGKGNPDEEILTQLFGRLDIIYERDAQFLLENEKRIREYFRRQLYELDTKEIYQELRKENARLCYSPLAVDWLLLSAFEGEKNLELLEELTESMDRGQLGCFYILKSENTLSEKEKIAYCEQAVELLGNTYAMRYLLYAYFVAGEYTKIHYLENRFVAMALEEGNTYALADFYYMNGSAYACVDMDEMMLAYYEKVEHLLENTGWKDEILPAICYNIGAVYVARGEYELALSYLNRALQEEFLVWHKKAVAYLKIGKKEELEYCMEKMGYYLEPNSSEEESNEVERLMYEELALRSETDYLENEAYHEVLEALITILKKERTFGFLYFYRDVVSDAYVSRRKYRMALEFERELSSRVLKRPV